MLYKKRWGNARLRWKRGRERKKNPFQRKGREERER